MNITEKSKEENLSPSQLNDALGDWKQGLKTRFAPSVDGTIMKIETLNGLMVEFFKSKKGLVC